MFKNSISFDAALSIGYSVAAVASLLCGILSTR
jgi:hypothetical protein